MMAYHPHYHCPICYCKESTQIVDGTFGNIEVCLDCGWELSEFVPDDSTTDSCTHCGSSLGHRPGCKRGIALPFAQPAAGRVYDGERDEA